MAKSAHIAICAGVFACVSALSLQSAVAQGVDTQAASYEALLNQIADIRITTAQREVMLQTQEAEINSLQAQILAAPATGASLRGMIQEMTAKIEKQIEKDIPFRSGERYARLNKLQSELSDSASRDADLFRRALTLYDAEVNYGNSISAYTGDNPVNPGGRFAACQDDEMSARCALSKDQREAIEAGATIEDIKSGLLDGNYVHFGRLSFVYLETDSSEGYRWNQETKSWDDLPSGDILNVRRAVRVARGESAPSVVTAPIMAEAAE